MYRYFDVFEVLFSDESILCSFETRRLALFINFVFWKYLTETLHTETDVSYYNIIFISCEDKMYVTAVLYSKLINGSCVTFKLYQMILQLYALNNQMKTRLNRLIKN